ncbi:hypothetical protein TPHA_0L01410 [Tetrapisispora phaffii CBS 4417]|uniref:Ketoreductase (KR) domain-containing protein n=1 Tax=Tetrapisispora phaffii (strain ATCC 24235 / CBS 4417 / NBRC 1672 / NRRL Y-8282 / UCD 70-5) TaxID=1071381 RepID=G8C018_TETPH|nr:hypothetical protein TPHA_0L01410 [Tetrapisispora phaffii CBS 4417]CCE65496.1 hypothetical protein TPHA_0L01410 [Tetrapisispora phaffii CBS 4417]
MPSSGIKPTEPAPKGKFTHLLYENFYGLFPNKPKYLPEDYPDLTGKTAIVTGSNVGIGFYTMKLLYSKNCNVISVVRTQAKGEAAKESILEEIKDSKGSITVVGGCDLADFETVKPAAKKIEEALGSNPLNIIIHNAGIAPAVNTQTSKLGYEMIFATNVMGPQLLQHFLDPLFLKEDDKLKRIVWLSSAIHYASSPEYGINWEDPLYENSPVDKRPNATTLYGNSKAANAYQAKAWATRHKEIVDKIGCVSVSCFPGLLKSALTRDLSAFSNKVLSYLQYDTIYGAYAELYAALNPSFTIKDQGVYIVPFDEVHEPRADIAAAMKNGTDLVLWDWIETKISEFF